MGEVSEAVRCDVCAGECLITEGGRGSCGKYTAAGGRLLEIAPEKYLSVCSISIETMPILHFYPKGKFLQITTTGCNFNCEGCVSTVFVKELGGDSTALKKYTAEELIKKAKDEGCIGITFMMNDPLASFFTFLGIVSKAAETDLLIGCSTNGYFTEHSAGLIGPDLDFVNIGVKGFDDESYRRCGAKGVLPVLDTIKRFYSMGVHIEISCMYNRNNEEQVENLAEWIADLDKDIPLQVMRFMPLEQADRALEPSIREAEMLCCRLEGILNYVYLFNSPGTTFLDTRCSGCGNVLIRRDFYGPMGAKVIETELDSMACPYCGQELPVKGIIARKSFREHGFLGGYPFTRGLEIVESILIASGVRDTADVVRVWEALINTDNLSGLHEDLQNIRGFIDSIPKYAGLSSAGTAGAEKLKEYLLKVTNEINDRKLLVVQKPRVYYAMGKPLFCLNGGRFENQLVEAAGGISVNKELDIDGRPGLSITADVLNRLNPDVIFISSFFSSSVEDFYASCFENGITVDAVKNRKIFEHPFPNIDFGSPRWILGLMNIANILHPDIFSYDIKSEAEIFYKRFYNSDFNPEELNLSFAKPHNKWKWDKR